METSHRKWNMEGALTICAMQSFTVGIKNSLAKEAKSWINQDKSFKENSGLPIPKATWSLSRLFP